jgi:light-regulated signal transduction histidine kinase (bacteriophytochrome)
MNAKVDLSNCDREPIHIPGAILPHGAMLVLDSASLEILQGAGDAQGLLGAPIAELLGRSADALFTPQQIAMLRDLCADSKLIKPRHLLDPALRVANDRPLDASVHRSGDLLVIEFEAADAADRFANAPLAAVQDMLEGIDGAGPLHEFCQAAADRLRRVIGYDRVMVYRFMPDDSGWVIAESREPRLNSFLDLHYPASDIPVQARALYLRNWLRLIAQVDYLPAPLTPSLNPRTGDPLDMSQATLRDVSPIHREYLRNMGVGASMSISIISEGRLWGLIACHHYSPRRLPRHLRAVCEIFGRLFSHELEIREHAREVEERIAGRAVLSKIVEGLASEEDYAEGLVKFSPSLIEYISAGGAAIRASRGGGVVLLVNRDVRLLGATPAEEQIAALGEWLAARLDKTGVFVTDRLGELWPPAREFAAIGSGLMAISISREPKDFIMWFRPEIVETVSWGGDPSRPKGPGPNGDRLTPRKSFEVWKQEVRGRSSAWTDAEREAALDLRVALLDIVVRRLRADERERDRLREHEELLMGELDHRVKNALMNVQALVRQSSRNAGSIKDYIAGLEARIAAMAKAHDLLTASRWESVSLRALIDEELGQYSRDATAISIDGPEIKLTPQAALALSLALHELATNAMKYGALSIDGGALAVKWWGLVHGGAELHWRESGGPAVRKPQRRGFGSTLIERALALEIGGATSLEFSPAGVACMIALPASALLRAG